MIRKTKQKQILLISHSLTFIKETHDKGSTSGHHDLNDGCVWGNTGCCGCKVGFRVLGRVLNVSHEMDKNLNTSPKMSYGVLECDIVMLQNCMLIF